MTLSSLSLAALPMILQAEKMSSWDLALYVTFAVKSHHCHQIHDIAQQAENQFWDFS